MNVRLIPLEMHRDERRGDVSVMENIPFKVKRAFCVFNVPAGEVRGGHAHKKCHQLAIAVSGAVLVKVAGNSYVLDSPDIGLYIPPLNMPDICFVTDNTTLLVLASEKYDKNDYIYGDK
jgi:UDP-2-acetamido-3-amino-2,3-dideoxy-glucuronate N-acetyltransferase